MAVASPESLPVGPPGEAGTPFITLQPGLAGLLSGQTQILKHVPPTQKSASPRARALCWPARAPGRSPPRPAPGSRMPGVRGGRYWVALGTCYSHRGGLPSPSKGVIRGV